MACYGRGSAGRPADNDVANGGGAIVPLGPAAAGGGGGGGEGAGVGGGCAAASTCALWCAIAIGALVQGWPTASVSSITICFVFVFVLLVVVGWSLLRRWSVADAWWCR